MPKYNLLHTFLPSHPTHVQNNMPIKIIVFRHHHLHFARICMILPKVSGYTQICFFGLDFKSYRLSKFKCVRY